MGVDGHAFELAGGEEVAADAVVIAGAWEVEGGLGTGLLDVTEAAVGVDVVEHAAPGVLDDEAELFGVEEVLVDAVGDGEEHEGGAGDFRLRVVGGIEEGGGPEAVGLLKGRYALGHFAELLDVEGAPGVVLGEVLEGAGDACHDPAFAARPEDLFAVGLALGFVGGIASVEVFIRVVEEVGGELPLLIEVVDVGVVVGGDVHAGPDGRGHKEGVAPPPGDARVVGLEGVQREERVEVSAGGRDARGIFGVVEKIELEVGLGDALVVSVGETGAEGPVEGLRHGAHGVAVFGIAGGLRGGQETGVEDAPGPGAIEVRLGAGELPVGYLASCLVDGGGGERGREVGGEGAGIGGGVAEVLRGVAVDACLLGRCGCLGMGEGDGQEDEGGE